MEGRELLTAVCGVVPRLLPRRLHGGGPGGCGAVVPVPTPVHSDCPTPGRVALYWVIETDEVLALLAPRAACKAQMW